MRVIVTGRLKQRNYETKGGEKRTVYGSRSMTSARLRNASAGRQGQPHRRCGGSVAAVMAAAASPPGGGNQGGGSAARTPAASPPAAAGPKTRGVRRYYPTSHRSNDQVVNDHPRMSGLSKEHTMAKPPIRKPKKRSAPSARQDQLRGLQDTGLPRSTSPTAARSARRVPVTAPGTSATSPRDQNAREITLPRTPARLARARED
jgi:single-stranded DNA-binding protein